MAEIWFLKFSYNGFCEKIQTSFGKALKISIQFFFSHFTPYYLQKQVASELKLLV